jgi:hypothetical protein
MLSVLNFVADYCEFRAINILADRRSWIFVNLGLYGGPNTTWQAEVPRYQRRSLARAACLS